MPLNPVRLKLLGEVSSLTGKSGPSFPLHLEDETGKLVAQAWYVRSMGL